MRVSLTLGVCLLAVCAAGSSLSRENSRSSKLAPGLRDTLEQLKHVRPGGDDDQRVMLRAQILRGRDFAHSVATLRGTGGAPLATVDAAGRIVIWLKVPVTGLAAAVAQLVGDDDVQWIERYELLVPDNDATSWLIQGGTEAAGRTVWQRGLTGRGQVIAVADTGLDVDACQFRYSWDEAALTRALEDVQPPQAVIDRPENKVITYYVLGEAQAYDSVVSGFHGTHSTGNAAGDSCEHVFGADGELGYDLHDGMAPGAQIVFQDIGSHDGYLRGLVGVSMYDMLEQAYSTGARIHSNSYGRVDPSPGYDLDSASLDEAIWDHNDLVVLFSAGNDGPDPSTLNGEGATAKNTLVVGASGPVNLDVFGSILDLRNDLLFFSSQGPTLDGRLKPDLVAPGMTFSATADKDTAVHMGCCDRDGEDIFASAVDDDNCLVDSEWPAVGTSFSTPITAGAAALVRQYFTDGFWRSGEPVAADGFNPTAALVKATLLAGAAPLTGEVFMAGSDALPPPDFGQGWGRVDLERSLGFRGQELSTLVLDDVANPIPDDPMLSNSLAPYPFAGAALQTDQQVEYSLPYHAGQEIMRVCLVWSDPPGAPGANPALVNDLDLELLDPEGQSYLGNRGFGSDGLAQPGAGFNPDGVNVSECLTVKPALEGVWRVTVDAPAVPGNGLPGSAGQGYALVATGRFLAPTPDGISSDRVRPGSELENVSVTGTHFVPGMTLTLGEGIELVDLEVLDAQTARIGTLLVAPDAPLGLRDLSVRTHHSLEGVGVGLLRVARGGCACASSTGADLFWLWLVLAWAVGRRFR